MRNSPPVRISRSGSGMKRVSSIASMSVYAPLDGVDGNLPCGLGQLPPCRVAQRHHHGHGRVGRRVLLGLPELVLHLLRQPPYVAYDAEAYVVLHEYLVFERRQHQPHQGRHLVGRTVPVLGREGVKREVFNAEPHTLRRYAAHRLHPGLVAVAALAPPFRGPPPIAVHDDGNVAWYAFHIQLFCHRVKIYRYGMSGILPTRRR